MRRIGFIRFVKTGKNFSASWRLTLSLATALAAIPLVGCVSTRGTATSPVTPLEPALAITPSSINFGSTVVGTQTSQTLKIANDGGAAVTVTGVVASGSGLSISGFTGSTLLNPGTSSTLTVQVTPKSSGTFSGTVSILTNVANVSASLPVTGDAAGKDLALAVGPTSVNFGTLAAGKSASQSLTLTNTGNSTVTVSQVTLSGTGFSMSGWSAPVNLASSQSLTVNVSFDSSVSGSHQGTLTVGSNASDSSVAVPLSGSVSAAPAVEHSVGLTWHASSTAVAGYNVYRGGASEGPFARLNGSLVDQLSFKDSSVLAGETYFYVTTAVTSAGVESGYSNAAEASIP